MTDSTKQIHLVYYRGAISSLPFLLLLNNSIQFMTKAQPPEWLKKLIRKEVIVITLYINVSDQSCSIQNNIGVFSSEFIHKFV